MKRTRPEGGGEDEGEVGASAEDGLRETRQRLGDEDAGGTGSGLNLVLAEVPADEQISKKSKTRSYAGAWSVCGITCTVTREYATSLALVSTGARSSL